MNVQIVGFACMACVLIGFFVGHWFGTLAGELRALDKEISDWKGKRKIFLNETP